MKLSKSFKALFAILVIAPTLAAQTIKTLHMFSSDNHEGVVVRHALIQAADGNFYGTAYSGGQYNQGTIFKISASGEFQLLYTFTGGTDGGLPDGGLIQGIDGNFYGTTKQGGEPQSCGGVGCGTVFQFRPDGTLTTLHAFTGGNNGQGPEGSLVQGDDGALYGITSYGGVDSDGTIFRVSTAGDFSEIYSFTGSTDGFRPASGLIQGSDGSFYGTTVFGGGANNCGGSGCGVIYKVTEDGDLTPLYSFTGGKDGGNPDSGLFEGEDGNLYGTSPAYGNTSDCNPSGCGTIFRISPTGIFSALYTFTGGPDGAEPSDSLFEGGDGRLYGSAPYDGGCTTSADSSCGTLFTSTLSGNFSSFYRFVGVPANAAPFGGLIQGSDGVFYGALSGATSRSGGGYPSTIYSFSPSSAIPAPVELSFSRSRIDVNTSVSLNWKVLNAFSTSLQQCSAFIQNNAAGAGSWGGRQYGTLLNGVYSGTALITPTQDGTYTYALTCGGIESGFATLIVGPAPALTVTTSSLPSANVGQPYIATLSAAGGYGADKWQITSGILPTGLTLKSDTGAISGTPQTAGSDTFSAEVSDSDTPPSTASASLTIVVNPAMPTVVLQVQPSSIIATQKTTLDVSVTGIEKGMVPTGTVQFLANGEMLGPPIELLNGSASFVSPVFEVPGTYSITAEYSGDGAYSSMTSPPVLLKVASPASSTSLTADPPEIAIRQPGNKGSTTLTVSGFLSNSINLSCAGLPFDAECHFGAISGTAPSKTATLEITTVAPYRSALALPNDSGAAPFAYALLLPFFCLFGGLTRYGFHKTRYYQWTAIFLIAFGIFACGCGDSFNGTPEGTYHVTIRAVSKAQSATTVVTLTVG